jgi:hypothetical protein
MRIHLLTPADNEYTFMPVTATNTNAGDAKMTTATMQIDVGTKIERQMNWWTKQYGEVIEVGDGRVRVQWTHMIYTPVKWDGKISRKINNVPTGEPERTESMVRRPKTWVKVSALRVI